MKQLALKETFAILEDCEAIVVDDNILVYPSLTPLNGDADNIFMFLEWEAEGLGYEANFKDGSNRNAKVQGSSIYLNDTDGNENQITILMRKKLD